MKIVQITDLHIDVEGEYPFDIDVRGNFQRIMRKVKTIKPDHIVISGDLCYRQGEADIYNWIKKILDASGLGYSIISGNHDNAKLMAEIFELGHMLTDDELFYAKKIGKRTFLFLDSSKGYHSSRQINWLKRQLKNANEDLCVFMHHPPLLAGVPFMDNKYALQDMKKIQKLFFTYPKNINIFCGHYHVEKTLRLKNLMIQITPSLFFQIDQNSMDFKVDHHQIAYRLIELNNGQISSTIKYLRGAKKS